MHASARNLNYRLHPKPLQSNYLTLISGTFFTERTNLLNSAKAM
ncbi:MAG: hypothetical protein OFPI_37600 [Osedax symbiont Rs2]|nr:MAG: hypothetical protein OFPI_37600 [Osedax symbiont Rs2]